MDTLKDKVRELNLLKLTATLITYLKEEYAELGYVDLSSYQYIKIYKSKVYLYSLEYIEKTSIDEFRIQFIYALGTE